MLEIRKGLLKRNKQLNDIFLNKLYDKCSLNRKFGIWLNNNCFEIAINIIHFIIQEFDNFDDQYIQRVLNYVVGLNDEEFKYFIDNLISSEPKIEKRGNIVELLARINYPTSKSIYYEKAFNILSPKYRLELWIDEKIEKLDIAIISKGFVVSDIYYQEKTIKKLFYYYGDKSKDKIDKFVTNLLSELENSESSIEVCLYSVIKMIYSKIIGEKMTFSQYTVPLLKLLSEKSNINIVFDSYNNLLEHCPGRSLFDKHEDSVYVSNLIPKGVKFCEGRIAIDQNTNEYVLENGVRYYWCKNQRCYNNALTLKEPENWNVYKLFNILKKIDKNITENDYTYQLGIINKLYQYFSHLKCRTCKSWLVPIDESNFGYDRVNKFSCKNESCLDKGEEIYINHCLNSKCNNIIDSRDSKQCSHNWYICDFCFACCSTEKIKARQYIKAQTGQVPDGISHGHDELEIIYCFKCGGELQLFKSDINRDLMKQTLNSFSGMIKTGNYFNEENNDKKKWVFIEKNIHQTNDDLFIKIRPVIDAGYLINGNDTETGLFINEPRSNSISVLKCSNLGCDFNLYLNNRAFLGIERINALKYHKKIKTVFEEE